jgi:hypothetical protein
MPTTMGGFSGKSATAGNGPASRLIQTGTLTIFDTGELPKFIEAPRSITGGYGRAS